MHPRWRIVGFSAPAWTPDGSRVAFVTWFAGEAGLGWLHSDGSGLIMTGLAPGATTEDLLFLPLHGQKRWETLFQAAGVERNPAIAPSGRFIAYNSDESGIAEVYVRPFPNAGSRRWQISTAGGAGPVWTRGGSEIVYQDSQGGMMAVAVDSDDNEPFSKPTRTVQRRT